MTTDDSISNSLCHEYEYSSYIIERVFIVEYHNLIIKSVAEALARVVWGAADFPRPNAKRADQTEANAPLLISDSRNCWTE